MSETGEQMKKRRKQLNMSADELAEKLGVSRSTIFRYEKGDIDKVPAEYIDKLAKALSTTPAYLMGWEENLETDTDFIPKMMSNPNIVEHVKLLVELSESDKKSVFDMIEFLYKKGRD
nr:MAG TPA: helix-turn-helix domain protein [Caudoviricetes sp.]